MQLMTFGIDKDKNLIVQFLIFIQPYTQQTLILYQLKTVPVPVIDQNIRAHSYKHLQVKKTIHCIQPRNIHLPMAVETKNLQKNWL